MSFIQRLPVVVTTNAAGAAEVFSPVITGRLSQIRYVKTDFADGSTITITSEATGETLWTESNVNASTTRAPRQPTHTTAGAASLYASGGAAVNDMIALALDRIKIVITSGGDTKTGTFHIVLG